MASSLRQLVRERAQQRCEYCRFSEVTVPYLVFHVDHIIAKQHLDDLTDDPETLAWACSECNFHKGPNLASIDPESQIQTDLFNPRRDSWEHHFSVAHGMIMGLTPKGRATARLLNMNAPKLVRLRRELIEQGVFQ